MTIHPRPTGLFAEPLARNTDPASSKQAARAAAGKAATDKGKILVHLFSSPGATASEIAAAIDMDRHAVNKRTSDLERIGSIRRGEQRRSKVTNRLELTWWPVEASE